VQRDIVKLRRWCVRKKEQGWSVGEISRHARVPKRTIYSWLERYREYGNVEERDRAPHIIYRTPEDVVSKVVATRMETHRNEYAIVAYLRRQGVSVSHTTVYNILKRNNLIHSLTRPRMKRTYRRFSREHPNSLWQADLTVFGGRYAIAFLDDCSRYLTGIDLVKRATAEEVLDIFDGAIDQYGRPRQIITDHGAQFYSVRRGESSFDRFCKENDIEHIMGSIGKPTTTGKIERFFQTFKREYRMFNNLDTFVDYYNNRRLHAGIGYLTPAEVYVSR